MRGCRHPLGFAFFIVLVTLTVARGDSENLIDNGNFESNLDGWWKAMSAGWKDCAKFDLANKTQSSENVHSGSHSGHITHTCNWELKLAYSKIINVTHEDWFELSY